MRRIKGVTAGLLALRLAGLGGLLALLWNPISSVLVPGGAPTVLLDASLSMQAAGGRWAEALDSARRIAGVGSRESGAGGSGVIWRFGVDVASFDTTPPQDGASRLGPALRAAAAREGPIVVVTDGEIDDAATLPPDLLRQARIVALPRAAVTDFGIERLEAEHRFTPGDTVVVEVTVARTGSREPGAGSSIVVRHGMRELARAPVRLAEGAGAARIRLSVPASRLPAGYSVLDVSLMGFAGDQEPRNDARKVVVEVTRAPAVVVVATPADWEARFLARALRDILQAPLKVYVETEPNRWRDAGNLGSSPVGRDVVARAVRGADLVILRGDPNRWNVVLSAVPTPRRWLWPTGSTGPVVDGDWYVGPPPASPLAAALAGAAWDSVAPATSYVPLPATSTATGWTALTARLARRSAERPVVLGYDSAGTRTVWYLADGLWRWVFRGGASAEAYRSLVAATSDWLLERSASRLASAVVPEGLVTPNGLPVEWNWRGSGPPRATVIELTGGSPPAARMDTLRFDAGGRASRRLAPGEYRYLLPQSGDRGVVVVERYSPEWMPRRPSLEAHPGLGGARRVERALRERWYLFLLVVALFAAEWGLRRRIGLP